MSWNPRILKNRPDNEKYGQYNYGNTDGTNDKLLGTLGFNYGAPDTDLYTVVEGNVPISHPSGLLYYTLGSKLEISQIQLQDRKRDTDGGKWHNFQVAVYIFDDRVHPEVITANTGNELRDLISTADEFIKVPWQRAHWYKGDLPTDSKWGGSDTGDMNAVSAGDWGDAYSGGKLLITENFPHLEDLAVFDTNVQTFTDDVCGKTNLGHDSSYYVIVRVSCDEREYLLFSGHKHDELNRVYGKCRIRKKTLYDLWKTADASTIDMTFHMDGVEGKSSDYTINQLEDNWGNHRGHSKKIFGEYLTDNDKSRNWNIQKVKIKITGPDWSPEKSNLPLGQGGGDNGWFLKTEDNLGWHCIKLGGAKPGVFDYYGFSESSYYSSLSNSSFFGGVVGSEDKKFFKSDTIVDFRPITKVVAAQSDYADLQNYYPSIYQYYFLTTAPNSVTLSIDIAHPEDSFVPIMKELNADDDINYYFYVVNWDWKEGDTPENTDPGGGQCEQETTLIDCISELGEHFPANLDEMNFFQNRDNTYVLANINEGETLEHSYIESGTYIIKALVLATQNHMTSDDFGDYSQVVKWKLATIKINLNVDSALSNDFADVGSDGFSFLPYPTTEPLVSGSLDDGRPAPVIAPSGRAYYKSHAIVGGLSLQSTYMESLESLLRADRFGRQETSEKNLLYKSLDNRPGGIMDEFGVSLGQTDINQVRAFDKPFSMYEFLSISPTISQQELHPHSDIEYWTGNSITGSFPKESLVGDIFINSWDKSFSDRCIVEINPENQTGKSIRDSSGNGNVGVLIGDFSVKKDKIGNKVVRDSYVDIPKLDNKDGAF